MFSRFGSCICVLLWASTGCDDVVVFPLPEVVDAGRRAETGELLDAGADAGGTDAGAVDAGELDVDDRDSGTRAQPVVR